MFNLNQIPVSALEQEIGRQVYEYFDLGQDQIALVFLEESLAKYPSSAYLKYLYALIQMQCFYSLTEKTIKYLKQLKKAYPDSPMVIELRAFYSMLMGDPRKSHRLMRIAMEYSREESGRAKINNTNYFRQQAAKLNRMEQFVLDGVFSIGNESARRSSQEPSHLKTMHEKTQNTPSKSIKKQDSEKQPVINIPFKPVDSKTLEIACVFGELQSDLLQQPWASAPADLISYQLRNEALELARLQSFEDLLCIDQIRGVEKLEYQIQTVKKALRLFSGRVMLCDEVGLGKTIEAGMIIKEYVLRGLVKRILVLVPSALVEQWREEMLTKFELEFITTNDSEYNRDPIQFWSAHPFILASIHTARMQRVIDLIVTEQFDMVVVDEAHMLKNRQTLAWKLVNSIKKRFILLLTATPVENSLIELFNLITLLKPGQLQTEAVFKREFLTRGDPRTPRNQFLLQELLRAVMIRNTRSLANIDLPRRYASTIRIEMDANEKIAYRELDVFLHEHGKLQAPFSRMVTNLLLREAGSSPFAPLGTLEKIRHEHKLDSSVTKALEETIRYLVAVKESSKAQKVVELLSQTREKVIIYTSFTITLSHLAAVLGQHGIAYTVYHGGLTAHEKDLNIKQFRNDSQVLLSTEVGGEGHNLQFCNTIINFDIPWNPMRIEQRIGRIHRFGQKRETYIFNLVSRGTIEEYLLEVLDAKINMFEMVIGEIDMIIGNLDDDRDMSEIILEMWLNARNTAELQESFQTLGNQLLTAKSKYQDVKKYDAILLGDDYQV